MKTIVFMTTPIAKFDSKIAGQFTLEIATEKDIFMERLQIGIRNEYGEIYRALGVNDSDFPDVVNKLVAIGFVNELEHNTEPKHGYDAIFRMRK